MSDMEKMVWAAAFVASMRETRGRLEGIEQIRVAIFAAADMTESWQAIALEDEYTEDMDEPCKRMALAGRRLS